MGRPEGGALLEVLIFVGVVVGRWCGSTSVVAGCWGEAFSRVAELAAAPELAQQLQTTGSVQCFLVFFGQHVLR